MKKNVPILAWAVTLTVCLAAFSAAHGQKSSEPECHWQAAFPEQLGIDPGSEPFDGQAVRVLEARVIDPDRLFSLGLSAVRKGDRIKMLCIGSDIWRIKNTANGLAITFSTRPF